MIHVKGNYLYKSAIHRNQWPGPGDCVCAESRTKRWISEKSIRTDRLIFPCDSSHCHCLLSDRNWAKAKPLQSRSPLLICPMQRIIIIPLRMEPSRSVWIDASKTYRSLYIKRVTGSHILSQRTGIQRCENSITIYVIDQLSPIWLCSLYDKYVKVEGGREPSSVAKKQDTFNVTSCAGPVAP